MILARLAVPVARRAVAVGHRRPLPLLAPCGVASGSGRGPASVRWLATGAAPRPTLDPPGDADPATFRSIEEATPEEFAKVMRRFEVVAAPAKCAERALDLLRAQRGCNLGNMVDMYEHALQTATRALRDGADEETVVCALLHDLGEVMSPNNHGEIAASLLRPYISPQNYWILMHHEIFQAYYYQDAARLPERDTREQFADSPHYQACVTFCEKYDQMAFDPDYASLPLEHFAPMVHRIFSRRPYAHPHHAADSPLNAAKMKITGGYPGATVA